MPSRGGGSSNEASETCGSFGVAPPFNLNVTIRPSFPYLKAAVFLGKGKYKTPPP